VVRVRKALTRETSAPPMASRSAISTIQTRCVQRRVLGAEFRQLVGEPFFAGQHLDRRGFARALRPLEDQHVVGLHAGAVDAGDGRDQP